MATKKKPVKTLTGKGAKVKLTKQAEVVDETASPAVSFIMASAMAQGQGYVDWSLNDVMYVTGKRRENLQGKYWEVEAFAKHKGGEVVGEWWLPEHYPVRDGDAANEARILLEHSRLAKIINGRGAGQKSRQQTEEVEVEVVDETTGAVTKTTVVRPRAKAPGKPRAACDPATGCQPGTSGHAVGLILLKQKPGKGFDRAKAIAEAVKELKMDKGLASSWVSTLIKRKPAFAAYGSC